MAIINNNSTVEEIRKSYFVSLDINTSYRIKTRVSGRLVAIGFYASWFEKTYNRNIEEQDFINSLYIYEWIEHLKNPQLEGINYEIQTIINKVVNLTTFINYLINILALIITH